MCMNKKMRQPPIINGGAEILMSQALHRAGYYTSYFVKKSFSNHYCHTLNTVSVVSVPCDEKVKSLAAPLAISMPTSRAAFLDPGWFVSNVYDFGRPSRNGRRNEEYSCVPVCSNMQD